MNIFQCVESYHAPVDGMLEVVIQSSERLVALGHKVVGSLHKQFNT